MSLVSCTSRSSNSNRPYCQQRTWNRPLAVTSGCSGGDVSLATVPAATSSGTSSVETMATTRTIARRLLGLNMEGLLGEQAFAGGLEGIADLVERGHGQRLEVDADHGIRQLLQHVSRGGEAGHRLVDALAVHHQLEAHRAGNGQRLGRWYQRVAREAVGVEAADLRVLVLQVAVDVRVTAGLERQADRLAAREAGLCRRQAQRERGLGLGVGQAGRLWRRRNLVVVGTEIGLEEGLVEHGFAAQAQRAAVVRDGLVDRRVELAVDRAVVEGAAAQLVLEVGDQLDAAGGHRVVPVGHLELDLLAGLGARAEASPIRRLRQ